MTPIAGCDIYIFRTTSHISHYISSSTRSGVSTLHAFFKKPSHLCALQPPPFPPVHVIVFIARSIGFRFVYLVGFDRSLPTHPFRASVSAKHGCTRGEVPRSSDFMGDVLVFDTRFVHRSGCWFKFVSGFNGMGWRTACSLSLLPVVCFPVWFVTCWLVQRTSGKQRTPFGCGEPH